MSTSKKFALTVGVALFFSAAVIGLKQIASQSSQQSAQEIAALEQKEKHRRLTLRETARLAKARNQTNVVVPALRTLYEVAQSQEELDQLFRKYTVVVATPTDIIGYVFTAGDSEKINTWYKFKIIDFVSEAAPAPSYVSWHVPSELYPINPDEFVMSRPGGSVNIEGISVTQHDEGIPLFRKSQKYLLLISLNSSTRIAELHLAPQGVLPIKEDNSRDENFHNSNLYQVIRDYHGGSLAKLKSDLQVLRRPH